MHSQSRVCKLSQHIWNCGQHPCLLNSSFLHSRFLLLPILSFQSLSSPRCCLLPGSFSCAPRLGVKAFPLVRRPHDVVLPFVMYLCSGFQVFSPETARWADTAQTQRPGLFTDTHKICIITLQASFAVTYSPGSATGTFLTLSPPLVHHALNYCDSSNPQSLSHTVFHTSMVTICTQDIYAPTN